jgi:hypothetical protein
MTTQDVFATLATLLRELIHGADPARGYVLNRGDAGLLAALERLNAAGASHASHGGATIAAHVAHVTYGLSLMNRRHAGENPTADWSLAWKIGAVSDAEWARLRGELRAEVDRWLASVGQPREVGAAELNDLVAEVAHVAYHAGAIRQIQATARGPKHGTT